MTAPVVEREVPEADSPTFSISEAALFLSRTTQWLRWRSEQLTTEYPEFEVPRAENGYRRYTLDTLTQLVELLYKDKRISKNSYNTVLKRVASFRE